MKKKKELRMTALVLAIALLVIYLPFSAIATEPAPTIGNAKNAADAMAVINNGAEYTEDYKKTGEIAVAANARGTFENLYFGETNSYTYSATVYFADDSTNYGSIRLVLGTGVDANNNNKYIEVCIRPNQGGHQGLVLNGNGETWVQSKWDNSKYGTIPKAYEYTVQYENGKVSFWIDNNLIFDSINISDRLSNINLHPGFYSQRCNGTISDIKLWGDVEAIVCPEFNSENDINLMEQVGVSNPVAGITDKLENCEVSVESTTTTRLGFYGIQYGDSYKFSAKAAVFDNKNLVPNSENEYNWEGAIFQVASAQREGEEYAIELRIRPQLSLATIYAKGSSGETLIHKITLSTPFDEENLYTIEYKEDGCFDVYKNGSTVFYNFDLTKYGYKNVTPALGIGGEVCAFKYEDIKLWGNLTMQEAPKFDSSTDIDLIPEVVVNDVFSGRMYKLASGTISSTSNTSGRVNFLGLTVNDDYTFYANASFSDNKNTVPGSANEFNWESLIFRVAQAEKDDKEYVIEIRVRQNQVLVYAFAGAGDEKLIYQDNPAITFDMTNSYIVDYHKQGTVDFWQNGISMLEGFDIAALGYTNIQPISGIGCEVCNFVFSDMKLVSETATLAPKVPEKPEGNGDYADTMYVKNSTVVTYESGKVYSTTNEHAATAVFEYLPFEAKDTYVYGFNINVHKAEKPWQGPRIIFGTDTQDRQLALFVMKESLAVFAGNEMLYQTSFARELYKDYRIDLLVEPKAVSVWVDDILLIENCATPAKKDTKTGILFEYAVAHMSNVDLYYTDLVEYVKPNVPEKPVLKYIGENQYNAADWMQVSLNNEPYGGYFGNKLICNDSSKGYTYKFDNMPISDDMSYYYSATYKVHESSAGWKGPRFIFRYSDKTPMYVVITQQNVMILAGGEAVASAPLTLNIGKSYNIVMYSTPTTISVWIDNVCVFESVDLSEYCNNGVLNAKMGLLFELCKAEVTNIAIYGNKVVFNPDYVDEDLYYNSFYRMAGVPAMPKGGLNLFQNITMTDMSQGSLGAKYDKGANVFTTEFTNGEGEVYFTDAKDSANLNGLKNGSDYVFAFTYKVDAWEAEAPGKSGAWFTLNHSSVPSTTKDNEISIGISGDALMLNVYKEGQLITEQRTGFTRENGKEYDIAVVHGKNWIKLYVDDELKMVSTKLPTYNVEFKLWMVNTRSEFSNFKLYELEDSGLSILETVDKQEVIQAGNTIYDAKEYTPFVRQRLPLTIIIISAVIIVGSATGLVLVLRSNVKRREKGEE